MMRTVVIPARNESVGSAQIRAVAAQLNSTLDEVRELRDLLAAYAVDAFGAFPPEVDRYFQKHPEAAQEVAR
ncbi:MAG: hypothetical protein HGB04_01690 [Chlorobiaceae bacterium]|nr:hypothetical protein [Chlorobiaceae bacterium]